MTDEEARQARNRQYFLKSLGTGREPVPRQWLSVRADLTRLGFPAHRRPHVETGDRMLIYASGHQRIVAAGEMASAPVFDESLPEDDERWDERDAKRWPWRATWRPLLAVGDVADGFELAEIGVSTLSVRSQSHVFIDEAQYRQGVGLLARAAASGGEAYVPAYRDSLPRTPGDPR